MPEVGMEVVAWCGQCKVDRRCRVAALSPDGSIERVTCTYCQTSRNYRPVRAERGAETTILEVPDDELRGLIRSVLREEFELAKTPLAEKWQGGKVIFKPGREGLQEKDIPIDVFFHKIVMVRDRLRVLEQQINGNAKLSDQDKAHLQQYITRCYGTLTTFNVLFKDKDDQFIGSKSES